MYQDRQDSIGLQLRLLSCSLLTVRVCTTYTCNGERADEANDAAQQYNNNNYLSSARRVVVHDDQEIEFLGHNQGLRFSIQ